MTAVRVEVDRPASIQCGTTQITFDPTGRVTLSTDASDPVSQEMRELVDNLYVIAWCDRDRVLFIGLEAKPLWIATPSTGELHVIANLDRLDLTDGYDPGGMHKITFQPLTDGDTLIIWEIGLARITGKGVLAWQKPFDETFAQLHRLSENDVWLVGENQPFGYRLSDGAAILS